MMSFSRFRHISALRRIVHDKIKTQTCMQSRNLANTTTTQKQSEPRETTTAETTGDGSYPFMSDMKNSANSTEFFSNRRPEAGWKYQQYVIHACTCIFMFYFLVLRKENHIDKNIAILLYEAAPDVERHDLRKKIAQFKKEGKNTEELEQRLEYLLKNKA